jgi:nitroimidazol reductase NimA-like FMN-containing flavoprotein (pyridoxamine 5'-phosphate oxidase superfamily)
MLGNLTGEQIESVLKENILGRLGCHDGEKTYVVPINYVYDGKHIIGHSMAGLKIDMMRKNPGICFEVDEMKNFTNWRSVVLWGQYQELKDEMERYYAMKLFVDRMLHLKISETARPPEITGSRVHPHAYENVKPVIYRLVITEKTGRFEN